jgi:hypothetical protein
MAIVYLEDGRLADEFQMGDEPYLFKDAIVMHPDDYAMLMPEDIAAMKQERYDKWYAFITSLPDYVQVEGSLAEDAPINLVV